MNRRLIFRLLLLAAAALSAAACHWRDLDYDYIDTAQITIIYDWSESGLATKAQTTSIVPGDVINGRTAAFYPVDGGAPVIKLSHSDTVKVNLLVGQYRAVFFNETFDDFDAITFEGIDTFEKLEARLKHDQVTRTKGDMLIAREPDILAIDMLDPFEVTEDMVRFTRYNESIKSKAAGGSTEIEDEMTVKVTPRSVVRPVMVDVTIQGIDDIASAGAYITGFADGYDFSERKPSDEAATHRLTFTERTFFEGSDTDGKLEGRFQSFGLRPQNGSLSGYEFEFRALLIDGTAYEETRSINDLITETSADGHLVIKVSIGSGKQGGGSDPPIVIPDVEPVDSGDGWQIDVGDWEEVVVPIDM